MNYVTVSIIIPVYNVEEYIEDCLQSVISQTMTKGVECILVDDCGQDESMNIAEGIIASYKGDISFRIIRNNYNKGLSGARNAGIKIASGEYIYLLDSDDEITPECISTLVERLGNYKYDVVVGDRIITGSDVSFQKLLLDDNKVYYNEEIPISYITYMWPQTAWNKLYRKGFIQSERLLFKEGLIHEDELWSLQIASLATTIVAVKNKTYIYRIRENSITTQANGLERKQKAFTTIFMEYARFLKERNLSNSKKHIPLLLFAFNQTIGVANKVNSKIYNHTFDECKNELNISIIDFIHTYHFKLKSYILNLHVLLPKFLGKKYYLYFNNGAFKVINSIINR